MYSVEALKGQVTKRVVVKLFFTLYYKFYKFLFPPKTLIWANKKKQTWSDFAINITSSVWRLYPILSKITNPTRDSLLA